MAQRQFKPNTPGTRFKQNANFEEITKGKPEKALTKARKRLSGRNSYGRITTRFRGGGHKRRYRFIDFTRDKVGIPATVVAVEYDPNRSARIALLHYKDGEKRYIIAPANLAVGTVISSGSNAEIKPGNTLMLAEIPVGENLHNIELRPGGGAKLVRSAGTGAQLMAKDGNYALIRMPSGEQRRVLLTCRATIGVVGNSEHANRSLGKAGVSRWLGRKPHQRGVTMNPVDHPMGGGEGKTSGGRHPVSPWGQKAKGLKTRNSKRTDKFIVRRKKS
jgi:large subunit ribosomal protein L2